MRNLEEEGRDGEADGRIPPFLMDPIGVVRRRGIWMAAVAGLLGLAGVAAVHSLIPVAYVASATILVRDQQIPDKFVPTSVTTSPLATIDAIVGEALSRGELLAIVDQFKLYPSGGSGRSALDLAERLRDDVLVEPGVNHNLSTGSDASIFTISFRYPDPQVSADVANALASRFVALQSATRGRQARLTTEFMRAELDRSERELRAQDAEVARFKLEHRGELPTEFAANSARLERLDSQRQSLALQISSAESRLTILAQGGGTGGMIDSPAGRLASLRAALAREVAVNTEDHPNVVSLRRQIERLEKDLGSDGDGTLSPDAMVNAAQKELIALKAQLVRIDAEARALEQRVAQTPRREEELTALVERSDVLRETYLANLRKVKQAELAESLESAQQGVRVQVIERAEPPAQPDRKRLKLFVAAVLAALGAAAAIGALLEILDPVIVSAEQLEDQLRLPLLGSVGRIA